MFTRAPDNAMDEILEMEVRRKRRGYEAQARREALQHGEAWEDPPSFGSSGANLKDILVGHHVDIPKHGQGIVKDYKSKKGHTIYLSTGETVVLDLTKKKFKFRVQSEGFLIDRVRKAMDTGEAFEREVSERIDDVATSKITRKRISEEKALGNKVKKYRNFGIKRAVRKRVDKHLPQVAQLIDRLGKVEEEVSQHLPADVSEVLALFTTMDEDDSGSLSMDELDGLPAISGAELTDDEVSMVKSALDTDKDGMIIWEEFTDWMLDSGSPTAFKVILAWRETVTFEEERGYELAQHLFTQLDKLDEGFIGNEQIQQLVELCEAPLTREELDLAHKSMLAPQAETDQVDPDEFAAGRNRYGAQGAQLNPLGLLLNPLGLLLCTSIPFIWRILSAFLRA
jgi:hypothetical protein